jgi:hypothetical protein
MDYTSKFFGVAPDKRGRQPGNKVKIRCAKEDITRLHNII